MPLLFDGICTATTLSSISSLHHYSALPLKYIIFPFLYILLTLLSPNPSSHFLFQNPSSPLPRPELTSRLQRGTIGSLTGVNEYVPLIKEIKQSVVCLGCHGRNNPISMGVTERVVDCIL